MSNENLENEFRYYSVKDMLEKTLQEISESMGLTDIDTGALGRNFNSVMDAINKATDIAIKLKNADLLNSLADLKIQIADLKLALADRKDEIATVRNENFELKTENKLLKEQLETPLEMRTVTYFGNYWYAPSDTEHEHPICKACYDSKNKINTLVETDKITQRVSRQKYICPNCKTGY
jgi:hypothetical protein